MSEIVQSIHDEFINTEVIRNIYRFLSQNERKVNKENYSVVRNDLTTEASSMYVLPKRELCTSDSLFTEECSEF